MSTPRPEEDGVLECGPFAIGSGVWPGIAKLAEELGELQQVIGKVLAYPSGDHPDGAGALQERLRDELADVEAACAFVVETNPALDGAHVFWRRGIKLERFRTWHAMEQER